MIFLADVSGSMELYARFFSVCLCLAEDAAARGVISFSTRLTLYLRNRSREEILKTVKNPVPQWSGGRRIGESLDLSIWSSATICWDDGVWWSFSVTAGTWETGPACRGPEAP